MTDMDMGLCMFFACTYAASTGELVLYRDGQELGRGELPKHLPAVLNDMDFGNWGARATNPDSLWMKNQPREYNTRNFVGRVDEITILGRVLTADKLSEIYESGKP